MCLSIDYTKILKDVFDAHSTSVDVTRLSRPYLTLRLKFVAMIETTKFYSIFIPICEFVEKVKFYEMREKRKILECLC